MRARRWTGAVLALGLSLSIATAETSAARSGRCSPLVVDPVGDEGPGMAPGAPSRPDLDLAAVDLSGDARTLILTVKTAGTDTTPIPPRLIDVLFDIKGVTYNAYKYVGPEGTIYGFNNPDGGHTLTGSTDARTNIVRLRIPVGLLRARPGDAVTDLGAVTEELVGVNALASGYRRDSAGTRRSYRLGTRGCI